MAKYPDSVLTQGKKGLEVRTLVTRGKFVICEYRDPNTMQLVDKKQKWILKDEKGNVKEYFIIPLKDGRKLMVEPKEKKSEDIKVWNREKQRAEELWQ